MAATRKKTTDAADTAASVAAETEPADETTTEPTGAQDTTSAETVESSVDEAATAVAAPVHTFTLVRPDDEPVRAGGHVLTDAGWIPEESLNAVDPTEEADQ